MCMKLIFKLFTFRLRLLVLELESVFGGVLEKPDIHIQDKAHCLQIADWIEFLSIAHKGHVFE